MARKLVLIGAGVVGLAVFTSLTLLIVGARYASKRAQ
jgi:hypothetical protein